MSEKTPQEIIKEIFKLAHTDYSEYDAMNNLPNPEKLAINILEEMADKIRKEERQRIIELAGEIIKEEHYSGPFYVLNKLIKNLK